MIGLLSGEVPVMFLPAIIAGQHVATDVRNYEEVKAAIETTVAHFGSLDFLVNCAAGNFVCPTAELSPNGWRTVIDIDLNGTFYVLPCRLPASQGVAPRRLDHQHRHDARRDRLAGRRTRRRREGGHPLAVTHARGRMGFGQYPRQHDSPGPIGDTEGVQRMYIDTGRGDMERKKTALGRFGRKADIANASVYLASDLGAYVAGENLIVDGGRWLKYVAA